MASKVLLKQFQIGGLSDFREISYIIVNENRIKFPVYKNAEAVDHSIAYKFVMNPVRINDLDELYDALDVNKGQNIKYLIMINTGDVRNPSDMSLQQKLFRKFFYENSSFIEDELRFLEITNSRVA